MNVVKNQGRQGDVFVHRIDALPEGLEKIGTDPQFPTKYVLAHGEVTGHCHAIEECEAVSMFKDTDGQFYLSIGKTVELTHQEHDTLTLEPGSYRVIRQREWSSEEERYVRD